MADTYTNLPEQRHQFSKKIIWFIVGGAVFVLIMFVILLGIINDSAGSPSLQLGNSDLISGLKSDDDPYLGNPNANIVLIEFGDFQCPFCQQTSPTIRKLMAEYSDEVFYIYRDFPITSAHPLAQITAEASMCVWEQDHNAFWSFHDRVFQNQNQLSAENITNWAIQSGADETEFSTCLGSQRYSDEVLADLEAGYDAGVLGTPTFFLNGRKIEGVFPLETWRSFIEQVR